MNDKHNQGTLQGGYSDIRIWLGFAVSLSLWLVMGRFIGLFGSFVVVAIPAFIGTIWLLGITKVDAVKPKRWQIPEHDAVYKAIELQEKQFNKENKLLRRNMKIIQEDEKDQKQAKKHTIKGKTKPA